MRAEISRRLKLKLKGTGCNINNQAQKYTNDQLWKYPQPCACP